MRSTLLFLAALATVLLTGCQVRTNVDIEVNGAGAGSVSVNAVFDREAAASLPNIQDELAVDDLQKAGWKLDGPDETKDGGYELTVSHGFANINEANELMAQLTGSDGAFKNFQLTQTRSLTSVKTEFDGTADLSQGVASFGTDGLAQKFGNRLGFDAAALQDGTQIDLAQVLPITLSLDLPGGIQQAKPQQNADGSWQLRYGQVTTLGAAGDGPAYRSLAFTVGAAVLLLAALVVALMWKSDKYRPQHRGNKGIRARDLLNQETSFTDDQL